MTPRRLLLACALASAFVAAAGTAVAALLWAVESALEPRMGALAAVAVVALAPAALLMLMALACASIAMPRGRHLVQDETGPFATRIWTGMKARPLATAALTVLGVILAIINPRYLGSILRSYLHDERIARR